MGKYSIKELEHLSGIKAHTIRIWEKRYNLIEPARTDTNIRFYSEDDLKKIINVALLHTRGIKISKIVQMTQKEIHKKILEISTIQDDTAIHIDQLVVAMLDMEEEAFEKTLNTLILRFTFEKAITAIIYPFLEKIGILWQTQNITPAHEHFISNLIRQKLIVAIDGLPLAPKTKKKVILFLPEGEMHEIGLLFYHYLTRKAGYRTYYLGQNVPHNDLIQVYETHKPKLLVTSIISPPLIPPLTYFKKLSTDFPTAKILIAGYQVQNYKKWKAANVHLFSNALEIIQFI